MQRQMSFLKATPPPGSAPMWTQLDREHRSEVAAVLARLIAKVATTDLEEKTDE